MFSELKFIIFLFSSKYVDRELASTAENLPLKVYTDDCNHTVMNNSFFGEDFHCDSVLDVNVILTSVKKFINATGSWRWERKSQY